MEIDWGILNLGSGSEQDRSCRGKSGGSPSRDTGCWPSRLATKPDLFSREKHRPPGYDYERWLAELPPLPRQPFEPQLPAYSLARSGQPAGKTTGSAGLPSTEGKDMFCSLTTTTAKDQNPGSTIGKFLGVDPKLQPQLDQLRTASQRCGVPYRICEVNSFSGGGQPGVSDTMASALWVLGLYVHPCVSQLLRG